MISLKTQKIGLDTIQNEPFYILIHRKWMNGVRLRADKLVYKPAMRAGDACLGVSLGNAAK